MRLNATGRQRERTQRRIRSDYGVKRDAHENMRGRSRGFHLETIRHYERVWRIPLPARTATATAHTCRPT